MKNGRDNYAILAKLLNDMKKSAQSMSTEKIDGTVNLGGHNFLLTFFLKLDYVNLTQIIQR